MNDKFHYVTATAIVMKDGKFLILKRSIHEKAFPGKWTFPGGKLERADYENRPPSTSQQQWYNILEDLVKREVMEESGLKIKNIRYVTSLVFIRPDNIPVVTVSFVADYDGGEIVLEEDMTDYAWVTLEEAKDYDMIEGLQEELIMLDKMLEGKHVERWSRNP